MDFIRKGFAFGVLFAFSNAICMDDIVAGHSEREGAMLREYHRSASECNRYFHMPKSLNELDELYRTCSSGHVPWLCDCFSPSQALWIGVTNNIMNEFCCRCEDGLQCLIDEFLQQFANFVSEVNSFHDQSFLDTLYYGLPGGSDVGSLNEALTLFVINTENDISKKQNLTRESTYLLYTVDKIDKILNTSPVFQNVNLAEFYRKHYLTDEFRNSPEYQAVYNSVATTFERGVYLTDL